MIGKVTVTSSGYDPNGPPVSDPTLQLGRLPRLKADGREIVTDTPGQLLPYIVARAGVYAFTPNMDQNSEAYVAEIVRRCNAYPELLKVAACLDAMDFCEGYAFAESEWPKLWDALTAARGVLKSLSEGTP